MINTNTCYIIIIIIIIILYRCTIYSYFSSVEAAQANITLPRRKTINLTEAKEEKIMTFPKFLKSLDVIKNTDIDDCKTVMAATLLNIYFKSQVVNSAEFFIIFGLIRNTKSQRVLHCVQSLAILSAFFKSKQLILKEKRLMTVLLTAMRSGCEDADRVQYYW